MKKTLLLLILFQSFAFAAQPQPGDADYPVSKNIKRHNQKVIAVKKEDNA